jgi:hypothetical protein
MTTPTKVYVAQAKTSDAAIARVKPTFRTSNWHIEYYQRSNQPYGVGVAAVSASHTATFAIKSSYCEYKTGSLNEPNILKLLP